VRTAELSDNLAEMKRETSEERAEWSGELRQLRRTLERQAELLADRLSTAQTIDRTAVHQGAEPQSQKAPAERPTVSAESTKSTSKDAVLGSVMAQFESLQRDRQKRRNQ
jgi:hypothetical protein